jgi:serine/threonine-protein kinase
MDRQGRLEALKMPEAPYEYPRVSPDGKRIAVGTDDGKAANIWIYELSGVTARRQLTFGGRNRVPVWTADGERVAFQSDREGDQAIFWQRADGNGTAERITKPDAGVSHVPQSWSPDGKRVLLAVTKGNETGLWIYTPADKQAARFDDVQGSGPIAAAFSPDGRWIVYNSTDGTFVQPFPATGAKFQVGGGIHPFWSPDGTEVFASPRGGFRSVKITTRPAFAFAPPVDVPRSRPFVNRGPMFERNVDIMPDGQRFVGIVPADTQAAGAAAPQIQVVEHWFEELRARVPGR